MLCAGYPLFFGSESFRDLDQFHCPASAFLIFSLMAAILFAHSVTALSISACWEILDNCFSRSTNSVLSSARVSAMWLSDTPHLPHGQSRDRANPGYQHKERFGFWHGAGADI